MSEKSSFIKREISKEDTIIQHLRPQLAGRVTQGLEVFERLVAEAETLTKLGLKLQFGQTGGEPYYVTPEDLKANLDEFPELERLATEGRALLTSLGYVSPRRNAPMLVGSAPVGKGVDVQPVNMQMPGSEPVESVIVSPKKK